MWFNKTIGGTINDKKNVFKLLKQESSHVLNHYKEKKNRSCKRPIKTERIEAESLPKKVNVFFRKSA